MQEVLKLFGWFLYDSSNCGGCGTGPKERWKNANLKGLSITVLSKAKMFVVRRENRVIFSDYGDNLHAYLTKIISA